MPAASSNFLRAAEFTLFGMTSKRPHTAETLAKKLDFLMRHHGYSEKYIEAKSGVSAKTVNNMRNGKHKPTVENAEKVAQVFGLDGWQLIIPGPPEDLLEGAGLRQTVESYGKSDREGREAIRRLAEREALYSTGKDSS